MKVIHYSPGLVPSDSDLSVIASRGSIPRTIVAADLNYAEVSEVYRGSDGEYYVATIARLYVPTGFRYFKSYDGNLLENFGTLSLPGSRMYPGEFAVEFGDTFAASNEDFVRFRLATAEEIAYAVASQNNAIDKGWLLNADGTMSPPDKCFPAHTQIQTSRTTSTAISALRLGDIVLSYDSSADKGRGALVPRRVTRLYCNTTTEWIRLRWQEHGAEREIVATPGHHFLNEFGQFPTIAEMTRNGSTMVVLASGALAEVTAKRITYSVGTTPVFVRGMWLRVR